MTDMSGGLFSLAQQSLDAYALKVCLPSCLLRGLRTHISEMEHWPNGIVSFCTSTTTHFKPLRIALQTLQALQSRLKTGLCRTLLFMLQDMSIVTGDPVKFGLALVSIGYCVVLLIQHYVLYRERKPSHYAAKPDVPAEDPQATSSLLPNVQTHDDSSEGMD